MNSKVGRLIESYDLGGMGDRLVDSWTGRGGEQRSLRDLAAYFNRALLRAAMDEAGMAALDGEVANTYRLLTAEDVSTGIRTQAETSLERAGIDPEVIRRDFVSHQAIYTYLTKEREVERDTHRTDEDRIESARGTIQRLRSRLAAVTEKRLESLGDAGALTLGTVSVLIDVQVVCEDCGANAEISTLLAEGGCDCESGGEN